MTEILGGCFVLLLGLIGFLVVLVGVSAAFGFLFMMLFNYIVLPFGGPVIGFKTAWAMWFFLCLISAKFRRDRTRLK